jgi:predicted transcriptional regulator
MTSATAICEIVNELHKIGIGMAEAKVFVAVNSNPMRDIASASKTPYDFCSNKLFFLMRKGLVRIEKIQRPALYNHTKEGEKAMKSLMQAGMKQ